MTSIPANMRALRQPSLTGPVDLQLVTDAPVPSPDAGEVLIRVTAAGVNFADVMQTRGTYEQGPTAPYIAGFEAVGVVVGLGAGVTSPEIGAHIIGTGSGAFAEYMTMVAATTAFVPRGWADSSALGFVLNWATALAAIQPLGRLAQGESVLIHAAAGGVGQAAVRIAKHVGATVIASASSDKHSAVMALGADHFIDYRTENIVEKALRLTHDRGADLVLESIGGDTFAQSITAARRVTGRVVVYGAAAGEASITNRDLTFRHQIQLIGLHIGTLAQDAPELFANLMRELSALRAAGVYPPGEPTIFPLNAGPKVLAALESGRTIGKLALRP